MALLFCVLLSRPLYAVDTPIGAVVCGADAPGASVEISEPLNDSVVNQSVITLRGIVGFSSQVEVFIDGNRDQTLAIGASQTSFNTTVSLTEGSNTIELVANDICNAKNARDSVAITFQPMTQPSNGVSTPTVVEQANGAEPNGAVPGSQSASDPSARTVEQTPVIGPIIGVIADFASAIGLETTVSGNNTTTLAGTARVGLTVAAITSVVMASSIAPAAAHAIPGLADIFDTSSHRSMLYLGWAIRGVGVLAMALAYFI